MSAIPEIFPKSFNTKQQVICCKVVNVELHGACYGLGLAKCNAIMPIFWHKYIEKHGICTECHIYKAPAPLLFFYIYLHACVSGKVGKDSVIKDFGGNFSV